MNTPKTLGERITLAREGKFTQGELAGIIGISQNTISRYENNKRMPKGPIIQKICDATGVNSDWLLSGKGEQNQDPHEKTAMMDAGAIYRCSNCVRLEQELYKEREESREINTLNRKLQESVTLLLRENGELKVANARLEERLKVAEGGQASRHSLQSPVRIMVGIE